MSAKKAKKKKISLCMIVKDEERYLPACLESVRTFVHEIIIVDTGSKDRTVEIAKKYGAKVFYTPWEDDFAKARNVSLEKATGDWILHLDADEQFEQEDKAKILSLVRSGTAEGYLFQVINYNFESTGDVCVFPSLRLWKNKPEYRFVGALHEQISLSIIEHTTADSLSVTPIRIHHYGYAEAVMKEKRKTERNIKIAELEVKKHPENGFYHYNLGTEYLRLHRYQEAIQQFQLAWEHSRGVQEVWVASLFKNYTSTLLMIRKFPEALHLLNKGIQLFPDFADLFYLKAVCHFELGQYHQAAELFQQCLMVGASPTPQYPSNKALSNEKAHYALALAYEKLNQVDKAIHHFQQAYLCNRNLKESLYQLFPLLCRKDSMEQARTRLHDIVQPAQVEEYTLLAQIFMTWHQYSAARHCLLEAERIEPNNQQIFYLAGICSLREGNYAQAVYWFKRLDKMSPNYDVAQLFLYYCYAAVGQQEAALHLLSSIEKNEPFLRALAKVYLEEAALLLQEGLFYHPGSSIINPKQIHQIREVMSLA
ncbi:TPR domain-containing glycosyltransferase [Aneurinibacillus aneurinilyticus]|jgi:glycosyltransferase involved in cell wall biosynthesis|uniref:Glycosyltransferase n=1 Tax=Aneurinibacillus aneurinilyticus TaxID=1391 RepID=A0A848CP77_ANEAE|nr:TPR domain-containing glycosyltransferase [Aneurinibacillus aneurinilyticus]MCI1693599.1 glycosyltransferase [Aneurinibacillus aneurinilyticus]MED0669114.1 glycosyltransferase [Aneurinibacillus aneurinilyticus]NME97565.1 glycosyltransferase [Aneurinibacillus aneurinilyticus]